jgi:hypothetical protein
LATIQEERAARPPEERRDLFAREYVASGGKLYASAVSAGFPAASASVRANELMRRDDVLKRIDELLREKFVVEGQKAHTLLIQLSKRSSQKDAVRLRAAKELMVLGGLFKKADAAAHAADAVKRSNTEIVEWSREFSAGMLAMLCQETASSGHQTGISFTEPGVFRVVNAERASEHLNQMWHRWTVTIPAKYATTGQTLNIYRVDEPIEEENEDEDQDWVAE